jgi:hypothetical protein
VFTVNLIKSKKVTWPHMITDTEVMSIGSTRPLGEARGCSPPARKRRRRYWSRTRRGPPGFVSTTFWPFLSLSLRQAKSSQNGGMTKYRVTDALAYAYEVVDPDALVRATALAALRDVIAQHAIDAIYTTARKDIEREVSRITQAKLDL